MHAVRVLRTESALLLIRWVVQVIATLLWLLFLQEPLLDPDLVNLALCGGGDVLLGADHVRILCPVALSSHFAQLFEGLEHAVVRGHLNLVEA